MIREFREGSCNSSFLASPRGPGPIHQRLQHGIGDKEKVHSTNIKRRLVWQETSQDYKRGIRVEKVDWGIFDLDNMTNLTHKFNIKISKPLYQRREPDISTPTPPMNLESATYDKVAHGKVVLDKTEQ